MNIGAKNGIKFYLKPNWSKIREFDVCISYILIIFATNENIYLCLYFIFF